MVLNGTKKNNMLGLGITAASIDSARIYREADEFDNAADLDVWFDFGTTTAAQDAEISSYTNLGAGGATYNITSNVSAPTYDYINMNRGSIKFDGSGNEALVLDSAYSSTGKAYSWFMVLYRPDDSNDVALSDAADGDEYFQLRGGGASVKIAMADMSSDKTVSWGSTGGGTVAYTYQDASDAGSNGIQVIVFTRDSNGDVDVYNHFGQHIATSNNAVIQSAANITIGALGGTSSGSLGDLIGNIGEFGIYDAWIGVTDAQQLALNLATKWGAALV